MIIRKRDRKTAERLVERLVDLSFETGRLYGMGCGAGYQEYNYTASQREKMRKQIMEELVDGWQKSLRLEETERGGGEYDQRTV